MAEYRKCQIKSNFLLFATRKVLFVSMKVCSTAYDTKEGETISFYFVIDCEQVLKQGLERKSRELSSTQIKAIKQYDNLFAKLFL